MIRNPLASMSYDAKRSAAIFATTLAAAAAGGGLLGGNDAITIAALATAAVISLIESGVNDRHLKQLIDTFDGRVHHLTAELDLRDRANAKLRASVDALQARLDTDAR